MPPKTTNGYDRKRLGAEIRANTYLTELLQRNRQKCPRRQPMAMIENAWEQKLGQILT